MIFKSQQPDIQVPSHLSLWSWLFNSLHSSPTSTTRGFTDVTTKKHISYHDLKTLTTHLSTALVQFYGLTQGDVIIIYGKNSIWYPVATLSAVRVGAIGCGVSPEYTVDELAYSLKASKAKFVLTIPSLVENAYLAADKANIPRRNILLMDGERQGTTSIQHLIQTSSKLCKKDQTPAYQIPKHKTNRDICSYLCFSSGTTGLPKAVMISHANVMAQCLQIQQITPSDHDKILAALPFYHITGIVHQLHLPIVLSANVYVLPKFTLDNLLETVARYKVKELLIVPPILIRLVREPAVARKYDLTHLRRFSSGAAPLSKEILGLLEKQFPGTGFKQGYGMTESCSAITSHPPEKYGYEYAHKVGMIVSSTEVKVVDAQTGESCGVGVPGEIWARGPQIAMGYLNNVEATRGTFDEDGFLHTGDIGIIDEEGMLSITDRMKEMIKVKGIGVAPAELENLILGHPLIQDVAVTGILDERAGERPKAFVVLKDSGRDEEEQARDVIRFSKEKSARHKWIKEVEVVEVIPKSAAGKILRRKLGESRRGVVVRDGGVGAKL